jgi:oligosaccharide translocation protein RFT1
MSVIANRKEKRTTAAASPENDSAENEKQNDNHDDNGKNHDNNNNNVARIAARGTMAALVLRLVSFACSQWTLRVLDPETLGRASIQLDLIMTTVLFISREGFRLALMRGSGSSSNDVVVSSSETDDDDKKNAESSASARRSTTAEVANNNNNNNTAIWNVAWLSIPVSTLVSITALLCHLYSNQKTSASSTRDDIDYWYAGILYCLACCIEGCAEPPVLHALRRLDITTKASAEGLATVGKTVTTVVALQYTGQDWPITAFGIAQLVYAIIYAVYLYSQTWSTLPGPDFFLRHRHRSSQVGTDADTTTTSTKVALDAKTCYMTLVFTLQGSFKHFLTEGDRILLAALAGSYDQGVYAMGSAYGGLAARVILQPIEENARLLWSRLAAQLAATEHDKTSTPTTSTTTSALASLEQTYTVLVKLVLYVGFVFSCLAVNYTTIILNLLAGQKWGSNAEATAVLSAFCVYTAFLAWNGCTEAFVYATLSSGIDVGRLTLVHTLIGVIFATTAFVAVPRAGTVGLVAANCLAMCIRALYSVYYAARYFTQQQRDNNNHTTTTTVTITLLRLLTAMFPHPIVILSFFGSFLATQWSLKNLFQEPVVRLGIATGSKLWFSCALQHISIGAACAIGTLTLAAQLETSFRQSARSIWKGRHQD